MRRVGKGAYAPCPPRPLPRLKAFYQTRRRRARGRDNALESRAQNLRPDRRTLMGYRSSLGVVATVAVLSATLTGARAFDESKYPNWRGLWQQRIRSSNPSWDASAAGSAPLTP